MSVDINQSIDRYTNERKRCAEIARASFNQNKYIDMGYKNHKEYYLKEYNIKKSTINDNERIGKLFIKKDKNGLPDSSGETWLKERYNLPIDLPVTTLIALLPLYHGEDEEIKTLDRAFDDFGLNADTKTSEVKKIVDQIRINPKRILPSSNSQKSELEIYQSWSDEVKDRIFEIELKNRIDDIYEKIKMKIFDEE